MAFSHGGNDAQKTMGVITMALASYYGWTGEDRAVPLWVVLAAVAMGLGTAMGGGRIVRTVGLRVVDLRPIDGFAAAAATTATAAAAVIEVASRLGIPVSTTHVISSAILGVGATKRLSAVRWGVAGRIVSAWVITLPACMALIWMLYTLLRLITGHNWGNGRGVAAAAGRSILASATPRGRSAGIGSPGKRNQWFGLPGNGSAIATCRPGSRPRPRRPCP